MKTTMAVLSVLATVFFFGAMLISCLPSAAVRKLARRVFGGDERKR